MIKKPETCRPCILWEGGQWCGPNGFSLLEGDGSSGLMVIAEALGRNEEKKGLPLRPDAKAGGVYQKALDVGKLPRLSATLTNIVRCRPPGNELKGMPYERAAIDHCRQYLDAAIAERSPRLLLALGDVPLRELSLVGGTISELRGYVLPSRYGIPLIACVDPETECLTARGWKSYYDLKIGEAVATLNSNGKLEWQPLQHVHIHENITTKMLHVRGQCLDMFLSSEHRCIVRYETRRDKEGKRVYKTTIHTAADLKSSYYIPLSAEWESVGQSTSLTVPLELIELLGWYIAEGSPHGSGVRIYQSRKANPKNCNRIEFLLKILEAKYHIGEREEERLVFGITGFIGKWLRKLSPDKQFPKGFLLWDRPALLAFFSGLYLGDGSTIKDNISSRTWHQKDEQRVSDFQALCVRLGWTTSLQSPKHGVHRVGVYPTNKSRWRGISTSHKEWVNYSGTIWCPQTAAGTWVARRKGKVFITGNSYHPSHLARGAFGQLFGVFLQDVRRAYNYAINGVPPKLETNYILDPTNADIRNYLDRLRSGVAVAYDIETPGILGVKEPEDWREKKIIQIQFSSGVGEAIVFPWREGYIEPAKEVMASSNLKMGWNNRLSDRPCLKANGVTINGEDHDLMNAFAHLQPNFVSGKDASDTEDKGVPARLMSLQSCVSFYYPYEGVWKGMVQEVIKHSMEFYSQLCLIENRLEDEVERYHYVLGSTKVQDVLHLYGARDADMTFRVGVKIFNSLKKLGLW